MGTLYIVATPIGNLQDISLRAIELIKNAEFIACEDTRRTGILLKYINDNFNPGVIPNHPTLLSYYEENEFKRIPQIITVLKNGKDVLLISDAGTPTISDPGFKLVRECVGLGIKIESIPGASSVISSLVISSLPTDKFLFLGYLPEKQGNKKKLLNNLKSVLKEINTTVILFESPYKILRNLEAINEIFGNIQIIICRELTKIHEEVRRERVEEAIIHFQKTTPKGEFVILFNLGAQSS